MMPRRAIDRFLIRTFTLNALKYAYGLPLLLALTLAAPTPLGEKTYRAIIGMVLLLPIPVWGLACEALLAEALQRGWRLRLDDFEATPELWTGLESGKGDPMNSTVTVDVRPAAATADPGSAPIWRTFDIRSLLNPPAPGQDKLDQWLAWLAEQNLQLRP